MSTFMALSPSRPACAGVFRAGLLNHCAKGQYSRAWKHHRVRAPGLAAFAITDSFSLDDCIKTLCPVDGTQSTPTDQEADVFIGQHDFFGSEF